MYNYFTKPQNLKFKGPKCWEMHFLVFFFFPNIVMRGRGGRGGGVRVRVRVRVTLIQHEHCNIEL